MHRCWFFGHGWIKHFVNFKGIFVAVFFALLWWQCARWYESYLLDQQAQQFNHKIQIQSENLSKLVANRLELLSNLNAFVKAELDASADKTIPASTASAFISGLGSSTTNIRNFALAPNGVINFISPLAGNHEAIGLDLLKDTRPASAAATARAQQRPQAALTNPLELLQGGLGLVARLEVQHQNQGWGFISIAMDVLPLLQESGLVDFSNQYHVAIRDRDGHIFYGNKSIFTTAKSSHRIALTDGFWEIAAQPYNIGKEYPAKKLLIFEYALAALLALIFSAILIYQNRRHNKPPANNGQPQSLVINPPSGLAPALATAALIIASLVFYWLAQQENKAGQHYNLDSRLNDLEQIINRKLTAHRDYFTLITQQIAHQAMTADEYQNRVSQYVQDHPGLINVTWADKEFIIRHTAPYEANKQVVGLALSLPEPKRASRLAHFNRSPIYTKPFVVIQGHPAFELYLPIYNQDEFLGTLGLVYSLEQLMAASISAAINQDYKVELLDRAGITVYSNSQRQSPHSFKTMAIGSLQQELWLRLSAKTIQAQQNIQQLLLVAGIMLFGIAISLWLQFRESRILWNRSNELQQSQKHFRAIAQSSPMAIVIIAQKSGNIIYANALAEQYFKGSRDTVVGDQASNYYAQSNDQLGIQKLLAKRKVVDKKEVMLKNNNGHEFLAALSLKAVQYDGVRAIISSITDLSERKRHEDKLFQQTNYDSLTGLPNRGLAFDHLKRAMVNALHNDVKIALMVVDLDHFKIINDKFGHNTGDQVLQQTAQRITRCIRPGDTVARLGADEFTLILPQLESTSTAESIAEQIIQQCTQAMVINGHEFSLSASIGITIFPDDGRNQETLLKNSEIAMYKCKEDGRNHFRFYTEKMNQRAQALLEKEVELRQALARGELSLHYQALFNSAGKNIEGAEALLRWHSKKFGPVSPAEFIPMAESMGIINELGQWVLNSACAQMKLWLGQQNMPRYISVNISGNQFRQGNLPKIIRGILSSTGLPAKALQLEITESVLIDNTEDTRKTLDIIHAMGVSLAIDDFGTGYSSLSYLRSFPFDTLKIDRAFVKDIPGDIEAEQLVSAIISMASILGLKTVAEGVETAHQLEYLGKLNCTVIQGFYLAKPLPKQKFEQRYSAAAEPAI